MGLLNSHGMTRFWCHKMDSVLSNVACFHLLERQRVEREWHISIYVSLPRLPSATRAGPGWSQAFMYPSTCVGIFCMSRKLGQNQCSRDPSGYCNMGSECPRQLNSLTTMPLPRLCVLKAQGVGIPCLCPVSTPARPLPLSMLDQRGACVTDDKCALTQHHLPKSAVDMRVHSQCDAFCGSGQSHGDFYLLYSHSW